MDERERIARIGCRAKDDAPPNSYRLFWFDDGGKIVGFDVISAENDAAALEIAKRSRGSSAAELWDRDRMIARLS